MMGYEAADWCLLWSNFHIPGEILNLGALNWTKKCEEQRVLEGHVCDVGSIFSVLSIGY